MKHKKCLLVLTALCLNIVCTQIANATIYVSEIVHAGANHKTATLLSVFKDDGIAIREIPVPGIMVRVSPDQKSIVYVGTPESDTKTMAWDVFISDLKRNTTRALPFLKPLQKRGRSIAGLEWSPQGDKLLIFLSVALQENRDSTYPVSVIVYDMAASTFRKITSLRADSLDKAPLIHAGWFPDNRRVWTREILQDRGGAIKIIDTERTSVQIIFEGMADVQSSRDGSMLFLICPEKSASKDPRSSQRVPESATLKRYHVQAKRMEELGRIPYSPLALIGRSFLLGADSDHLFSAKGHVYAKKLIEYQISTQTTHEGQSSQLQFVPKAASPRDDHVACGYGYDMHEKGSYGLMHYKTMQYKKIKSFSEKAPSGEGTWGGLMLNRIEWF